MNMLVKKQGIGCTQREAEVDMRDRSKKQMRKSCVMGREL